MTHSTALELLKDARSYLSALHGSVARHDQLAANLGCGGCELRDRITAALPQLATASPAGRCANDTDGDGNCAACAHNPEAPCRQPLPDRAMPLSDTERQFLTFALDLAADRMASHGDEFGDEDEAALKRLRRVADESTVTPPPALTEEGRLRAQVEVLQQDAERDRGLAKVGARCMREGHQGLIEGGRAVIEGWRFALSTALDLGTDAPWEAIHERVKDLRRVAAEEQPAETWLTDSARIGRALIWSWDDVGVGEFGQGYRAAQAEVRALLGGERGTEQQRPVVGEQPDTQETRRGGTAFGPQEGVHGHDPFYTDPARDAAP